MAVPSDATVQNHSVGPPIWVSCDGRRDTQGWSHVINANQVLAAAEIAGAAGLGVGLFWWPIGVAAATGVIVYFLGAVASHLLVRDKDFTPAAVLLLAAVAALTLRATST